MTILKLLGKADAFTILNAALGFLAITYISDGKYVLAEALILLAVVADGVDGIVARRFGGGKAKMGDYLDIMADYLSFCVAPAILFYQLYFNVATTPIATLPQDVLVGVAAGAFVTLGLLRLARHVAMAGPEAGRFQGLPTTGAGLFVTLLVAVGGLGDVVTSLLVIGAASLMVSEAPYPKIRGQMAYFSGAFIVGVVLAIFAEGPSSPGVGLVLIVALAGAAMYVVSGLAFTAFRVPLGNHDGHAATARRNAADSSGQRPSEGGDEQPDSLYHEHVGKWAEENRPRVNAHVDAERDAERRRPLRDDELAKVRAEQAYRKAQMQEMSRRLEEREVKMRDLKERLQGRMPPEEHSLADRTAKIATRERAVQEQARKLADREAELVGLETYVAERIAGLEKREAANAGSPSPTVLQSPTKKARRADETQEVDPDA